MKSFFLKKVTPPDMQTRNKLLRKLAILSDDKSKIVANFKKELRARLKLTTGSIDYFRFHKGIKTYLGDENTRKKQFLVYLDEDLIYEKLRHARLMSKAETVVHREKHIFKQPVIYKKIGGVLREPDTFVKANKKIKRQKVYNFKPPTTDDEYIGLEMEFASRLSLETIADIIGEHNLQDSVRAMRDGSIEPTVAFPHQVEICVLTKAAELTTTLEKLKKIITPDRFEANRSCGLHVHIDARCEAEKMKMKFRNLVSMQSIFFGLSKEHRRENRYCHPVNAKRFEDADSRDHYAAISTYSYFKHRTLEIRVHHSTLDLNLVEKWIKLIKKVADYNGEALVLGTFESEFQQLKEKVKIEPELIQYIQEVRAV